VLTKDPDWRSLPPTTPATLRRLLRLCLARDARQRLRDIGDARLALDGIADDEAAGVAAVGAPRAASRRLWILLAAGTLVAAALGALAFRRAPAPVEPVRLSRLTFSGADREPSASPDGKLIAFTSTRDGVPRIWLKQLEGGGEQPLTEGPAWRPRFSSDGSALVYIHDDGQAVSAYRIALVGGQPRRVFAGAQDADISPDGRRVAFVRRQKGAVVGDELGIAGSDGEGERVLLARQGGFLTSVRWSPDGRKVAVVAAGPQAAVAGALILVDPETGTVEDRGALGSRAALSAPAWMTGSSALLVALAANTVGNVVATSSRVVRYDLGTRQTQDLFWAPNLFSRSGRYSSVFTVLGPGRVCFDTFGQTEALRETEPGGRERALTGGAASDRQPVYSPDGRLIVFSSNRAGNLDLWSVDRTTRALRQITDDAAQDWDPAFTPDGQHLLFTSDRLGHMEIWMANADGSGARQMTHDGVDAQNATMTPDGWIVYGSGNPARAGIWRVRTDGSAATLLVAGFGQSPQVSPDGRYVIYSEANLPDLRREIRAVEVATGLPVDFRIPISLGQVWSNVTFGRGRWLPGGRSIAFVGVDERGRSGIFTQDFVPGRDTAASRRKLAGFYDDATTESLGISPDGSHVTISVLREDRALMLAENVPGVR
jgi:Tol biopolymer transport system component